MQVPLLCWDVFLMELLKQRIITNDLNSLFKISKNRQWHKPSVSVADKLRFENKVVIVTDTFLNIQFVTDNMYSMNGYKSSEVIGRSPKMFQGEDSEIESMFIIRNAIKNMMPFKTIITNYRKNGSIYNCHIEGYPIFNIKGELVNYVAIENAA
jgi:PAS domain S-box-containing protein